MAPKMSCGCFTWVESARQSLKKQWDNAIQSIRRGLFRTPTAATVEVAVPEAVKDIDSDAISMTSSVISAMAEAAVSASLTSIIEEAEASAADHTAQLPEVSV